MRNENELIAYYTLAKSIMTHLGYPAERLEGGTICLNGRLSKSLGRCFYRQKKIEIQKEYFYHSDNNSLMNTIIHELAHQVNTHNDKHGYYWKQIALNISQNTPYKITQFADADKLEYRKESDKYESFSCGCTGISHAMKITKKNTVEYIEKSYTCKKCKSHLKHVSK